LEGPIGLRSPWIQHWAETHSIPLPLMLESPALNVRTRDGTVRIIYIHLRRGFSGEQVVKYRTTGTGIGQGPQLPGHVGQWRAVVERRDDICSGLRGLQPHCVQELALVADRRVSDAVIFFSRKRFTPDKTIDELRFFFFFYFVNQRRNHKVPASAEDQGFDAPSRLVRSDGADHVARRPVSVLHLERSVRDITSNITKTILSNSIIKSRLTIWLYTERPRPSWRYHP